MSDDRLRLYVERIERISEEIAGLQQDRKDIYAEAKAVGYCATTLRKVVARRGMAPCDRAEADALLETYEAALGGLAPDPARDPDEASRDLALAILAEQIEGIGDPVQAALLAEHVTVLLDIRAEINELRAMERARKAVAASEGFDKAALTRVVRWIEKCAKYGADAMRAGEAVFMLYRGTVEGRGGAASAPVKFDPATEKTNRAAAAKSKAAARTAAWLQSGMGD
ncbi:DUF2312 domain-containing protein [Erythrobacter sp. NFXS35]